MADSTIDEATYLGYDHGLAMGAHVILSSKDAAAIVADDDDAWEGFNFPNLSGEYADDDTPTTLARDMGIDDDDADVIDAACNAWEEASARAFRVAVSAVAHRTLGLVDIALGMERLYESTADAYRRATGR